MTIFSTFCLHNVHKYDYFPQVVNKLDGRVYAELAPSFIEACRTVGFGFRSLYGLISLSSGMSLIRQFLATVMVLTMTVTICSTCAVEAMASTCCSEPCTECACGFEAMPHDADVAALVVVPSPQSFDPLLAYSVIQASSDIAPRTSHPRLPLTPLPQSTSIRLSMLSVYLI